MAVLDIHIHSTFSPDGRMTMEEAINAAISNGLEGIAFTDHLDIMAPDDDERFMFNPAEARVEIEQLKRRYHDFKIFSGIEAGVHPLSAQTVKEFLSRYEFDVIIASIHYLDGVDPYIGDFYRGKTMKESYGRYFEAMHESITVLEDFDILGHYDYIGRYSPYLDRSVKYRDFPDIFDSIFKYLIEKGKSLEINTNTYRRRDDIAPPQPDPNVLKRYREMGGELVSLTSDAHTTSRIAENFDYYIQFIKRCGFGYLTYFDKRVAVKEKI